MAGLCEGGNEPPGSLKASKYVKATAMGSIAEIVTVTFCFVLRVDLRFLDSTSQGFHDRNVFCCGRKESYSESHRFGGINVVTLQRNKEQNCWKYRWLTHRHDTTVHDVIRLLIPALYKNQSDSLIAADGDCHHLCKLMARVRHRWSINDVIGGIRNTVMPSDCSPVRFGIRSLTSPVKHMECTEPKRYVATKQYFPFSHPDGSQLKGSQVDGQVDKRGRKAMKYNICGNVVSTLCVTPEK
ncbi:hypothetical protein ANN_07900 [Periplaneta americana]|uniref:Uncharacterized protein n=1 Tax=Periplaneta americana TaxID=6978 RepID=A0ABQ8T1H5_PERAM|nr:hypothetical protein ANN_07900 [Periplaneta americana]